MAQSVFAHTATGQDALFTCSRRWYKVDSSARQPKKPSASHCPPSLYIPSRKLQRGSLVVGFGLSGSPGLLGGHARIGAPRLFLIRYDMYGGMHSIQYLLLVQR